MASSFSQGPCRITSFKKKQRFPWLRVRREEDRDDATADREAHVCNAHFIIAKLAVIRPVCWVS